MVDAREPGRRELVAGGMPEDAADRVSAAIIHALRASVLDGPLGYIETLAEMEAGTELGREASVWAQALREAVVALRAAEGLIDPVAELEAVGGEGLAHEDGWVLMPRAMAEAMKAESTLLEEALLEARGVVRDLREKTDLYLGLNEALARADAWESVVEDLLDQPSQGDATRKEDDHG
jgi:hypothetical protein